MSPLCCSKCGLALCCSTCGMVCRNGQSLRAHLEQCRKVDVPAVDAADVLLDMQQGVTRDTLMEWLLQQGKSGLIDKELTTVLSSISLACKQIATLVQRAGIFNLMEVQGKDQKKLDVMSNEVFSDCLKSSGKTSIIASKEDDVPVAVGKSNSGNYVVVFYPLDGSESCKIVCTGSIFAIYSRIADNATLNLRSHKSINSRLQKSMLEVCQPRHNLVAAGYCLYSSSVTFVITIGTGVFAFTLDPVTGEFVLTQQNIQIPEDGQFYAFEGKLDDKLKKYIQDLKNAGMSARYTDSMVGDFHMILQNGGIFGFPVDKKSHNGKSLLSACAPLSFLTEQCGGKASDGSKRILDIQLTEIHQRVPLYIGSIKEVEKLENYLA